MNMIIELVAEEQKRHVSMFDEYAIVNVWQTGWQMIAFRSHFVGINIYVIYLQIVEFGIKKQAIKMSINLVKWVVYSSYAWKKPLVITFYLQWMQISIKRCFGNWLTWSIIRINQRLIFLHFLLHSIRCSLINTKKNLFVILLYDHMKPIGANFYQLATTFDIKVNK